MPIEVQALPKDAFQRWLTDAKKKFAHRGSDSPSVRLAAGD
jgi:hypothetical protein